MPKLKNGQELSISTGGGYARLSPAFWFVWLHTKDKGSVVRRQRNPLGEKEAQLQARRTVTGAEASTSGAHGYFTVVCRVWQKEEKRGHW